MCDRIAVVMHPEDHEGAELLMHEYNLNQAAALEVLERRATNAGPRCTK